MASATAAHAPELSSILSALEDLQRRIEGIARALEKAEGGEVAASELYAVESQLLSGNRRLASLVRRL